MKRGRRGNRQGQEGIRKQEEGSKGSQAKAGVPEASSHVSWVVGNVVCFCFMGKGTGQEGGRDTHRARQAFYA